MNTPPTPTPTTTASIAKTATGVFAGNIATIVGIILVIVFAMVYFGQKSMMGTKYKVSDKESVNYSGNATEADAKSVGEALKANGYMSGKNEVDVLLKKNDKEGTVVSFVGEWDWKAEKVVSAFQQIGEDIAAKGLSKPLTIRLLDTRLNTKNEIKVP